MASGSTVPSGGDQAQRARPAAARPRTGDSAPSIIRHRHDLPASSSGEAGVRGGRGHLLGRCPRCPRRSASAASAPQSGRGQPPVPARHRSGRSTSARRRCTRGPGRDRRTRSPRTHRRRPAPGRRRSDSGRSRAGRPCSCGVSMPTSTAGPAGSASKPAASRSSRPPATCGCIRQPAGSHRPGAVEQDHLVRTGKILRARPGCRPARSSARSAASLGRAGTDQPGLHPPGYRLLGDHHHRLHDHRASTADMSRIACSGAAHRAGHLGPAGPGAVVDVASRRSASPPWPPAARFPTGIRCAGRAGPAPSSRLPARDPQRSDVVQPARRSCAGSAAPARHWPPARAPARRRDRAGRRRPTTRSAAPASTGAAKSSRPAGSIEESQSQKATSSAVAATRPAWQAAP